MHLRVYSIFIHKGDMMKDALSSLIYAMLYSSELLKYVWVIVDIIPIIIILFAIFIIWRRKMRKNKKIIGIAICAALLSVLLFSAYKNCRWMWTPEYVAANEGLFYVIFYGNDGHKDFYVSDESVLCPLNADEKKDLKDSHLIGVYRGTVYKILNPGNAVVKVTSYRRSGSEGNIGVSEIEYFLVDIDEEKNLTYQRFKSLSPLFLNDRITSRSMEIEKDGKSVTVSFGDEDDIRDRYELVFGNTFLCDEDVDLESMYKVTLNQNYCKEFYISDEGNIYGKGLSISFEDYCLPENSAENSVCNRDEIMVFIPDERSKTKDFIDSIIEKYNENADEQQQ